MATIKNAVVFASISKHNTSKQNKRILVVRINPELATRKDANVHEEAVNISKTVVLLSIYKHYSGVTSGDTTMLVTY